MGNNASQGDKHSKFTPTGNEQGSAEVQPGGQRETPDSRPPDPVEQRGDDDEVTDSGK